MFTSRAEYRLQLREDNADLRLTEVGFQMGLVDETRRQYFERKRSSIDREKARLQSTWVRPESTDPNLVESILGRPLLRESNLLDLLKRPEITYSDLVRLSSLAEPLVDVQAISQLEIQARYSGYIERQIAEIERQRKHETTAIPGELDYGEVSGLSSEVKQKLTETKPETIGQAARIPGMTPAAISLLLIHLKKSQRAA